jgi:D-glycero-D-manno-heptose 1,7-bisphosphate phosphatase
MTDIVPKPMIEFHGRPFLHYLIELFRDQGFERILLLLGYLPRVTEGYFGDGRSFGVRISYSVTPVENETGRRIKLAESQLDPVFLLAYCDNYWPMPFERMWQSFREKRAPALVTVYRDSAAKSRHNMAVDDDGYVVAYDKSRTHTGLNGNDIGFMILNRNVLSHLSEENVPFEATVFSQLIASRQLVAWVTRHPYYSVGSVDRLSDTNTFLARRPAILVDRDGVLNRRRGRAEYVCQPSDWEWLPGSREALSCLHAAGFRVIVITNQPGIARGALTEASLAEIHKRMIAEAAQSGGVITAVYHCPHGWDEGCDCRKPRPGMLFRAQREHHLDLSRLFFIGDDERDREAAFAAGCKSVLVADGMEFLEVAQKVARGMLH